VDDILAASDSKAESQRFTSDIKSRYNITDNGDVSWLLGCRITRRRDRRCLKLDQERYTSDILDPYGMSNCNSVSVPMTERLSENDCPKTQEEIIESNKLPYKELVGKLMYLATCTRRDIAFAVRELAKSMSNYGLAHWRAAKHLLRYLLGTKPYGIYLGNIDEPSPLFKAFTDSDWAQSEMRKSVCGYVIIMGGGPIAWSSKQQSIVALSSCEAEYVATTHIAKTVLWLRSLAHELGFSQYDATTTFCDNQGTIACTHGPQHHSKMKHIDLRFHFIRDCVQKRQIDVIYVPRTENVADLFAKPLNRIMHRRWVDLLGLDRDQGGVLKMEVGPR
jgi:hypothetical protein